MIIYQILNTITGKKYIGCSTRYNSNAEFQKSKYWGSGELLKKAIKKYGLKNFEKKVLLKNIFYETELDRYENLWIQKKNSIVPKGYNLRTGGQKHFQQHEETKLKISQANSNPTQETIEKMRKNNKGAGNPNFGNHHTEKWKEEASQRQRGEKHWNWGKHCSKETSEKISIANKGKKDSAETKKRKSQALSGEKNPMYGKKHRPESIQKREETKRKNREKKNADLERGL